ncbi:hypothetical protein B0T24DRAFT_334800 [Lasiosphaeria ovina]|uniref:Uncharacterized protein n=1 Tax=Lasiosphaeria ovina TaxID=92902 RepID=A0AAE0K8X2_9PEZI|nr:hypothetical protein B0T24DRAFT_334800 [Lasiosphaeria ovina]
MLGRLRADEIYMERCRANVSNLGSTWLKPPGVTKTLFQLREERREAEEHAEAVRREMLAAELAEAAEAEAGGGTGGLAGDEAMDGDEPGMDDDDDGGGRDLDEDVPDADEGGFGFDGASDDEDEDDDLDAEDDENDDADDDHAMQVERSSAGDALRQQRRIQQREFASRMATMRATEDRVRERMARGGPGDGAGDLYGADEVIDEEDQAHMLEEEDLVGAVYRDEVEPGPDMDMEADLDDEIPEAESGGGYEHTDSEASLSNSDDGDHNVSYLAPRARLPPAHPQRSSMGRGDGGPRSSIDISSILSRDGSSITGSSPQVRRRT